MPLGKTYTMLGSKEDEGLIPRLCRHLFQELEAKSSESVNHKVEVSYMEIYNEKVAP